MRTVQITTADSVMYADIARRRREKYDFAWFVQAPSSPVCDGMIDAAHFVVSMQRVPSARFVGMDGLPKHARIVRGSVAFLEEYEGQRAAVAFAHYDYDAALACLFLGRRRSTRSAALFFGFVPREIRAIHFDGAGNANVACSLRSLRAICAPGRKPSCIGNRDRD